MPAAARRVIAVRNSLDELLSNKWRQLAAYALLFAVAAIGVYIWFYFAGKSFVWTGDGVKQHFNFFVYLGKWARSIISSFLATGVLTVPMFDFSIGYGSDVFSTFSYYGLGEPLVWLSVLCPTKYAEVLYCALIIVRLFLAGLFFVSFCRYLKCSPTGSVAAAVVYVFSSWTLFAGVRHPFFLLPLIFLPLILLGAEKVLRKESPAIFMATVFLSALSNFYFFYMLFIAVFLYVLIRFACMPHEHFFKDFAVLFAKFLVYGIVGFLMAGILMVPVLLTYASSSRSSSEVLISAYSSGYYEALFVESFITPKQPGNWTYPGVAAPALLAVVLLFANKGYRELKIAIVAIVVFLCLPQAGYVFNAFSFVSNRWTWIAAFALAFALATMWNRLLDPSAKDIAALGACLLVYVGAIFFFGKNEVETVFSSMVLLLVSYGLILALFLFNTISASRKEGRDSHRRLDKTAYDRDSYASKLKENRVSQRGPLRAFCVIGRPGRIAGLFSVLMACLLVFGAGMNAYYRYDSSQMGYTAEFVDSGKALSSITDKKAKKAKKLIAEDGVFGRFDSQKKNQNLGLGAGVSTPSFYWSLCDSTVSSYLVEMAHNNARAFAYRGLNGRTFLNTLASVGYYNGTKGTVPYGYTKVASKLYKNENALPLGYTYASALSSSSYSQMDSLHKQEALMQGVVFDDDSSGLAPASIVSTVHELNYTVSTGSNVSNTEGATFVVGKAGSSITLSVECPANEEIYLYARNMDFQAKPLLDLYLDDNQEVLSKAEYDGLSDETKKKLQIDKDAFADSSVKNYNTKVSCGNTKSYLMYRNPFTSHYNGQKDFAVCLGTSSKTRSSITVTFPTPGIYDLGDLGIYAQPMTNYLSQVGKLKEDVLDNVEFATNKVSGTISLKQSKALLLTIPYSEGWSATVDGEPAELHRANGMFMALSLKAGDHQVELSYKTKGLGAGIALSLVGFVLFVAILVFDRRRRSGDGRTTGFLAGLRCA